MTDINKRKDELLTLKAEYEARIAKISDHLIHPPDELDQHWDDQAVAMTQNEMRKTLLLEAEEGLRLVNVALRRMENDSYGICTECGEEIEEGRLDAVPYASLCMVHAK
ncbi:MAG: TraR/DksA C4-type zinc finger protein [Moraxella sp.]|nr:TraR/DksA C4-type zinc finger protein [Moraxella sp.]